MIDIPRCEWGMLRGDIMICCPNCNRMLSLGNRVILKDGGVQPGVGCPYQNCGWHGTIRLMGWDTRIEASVI